MADVLSIPRPQAVTGGWAERQESARVHLRVTRIGGRESPLKP